MADGAQTAAASVALAGTEARSAPARAAVPAARATLLLMVMAGFVAPPVDAQGTPEIHSVGLSADSVEIGDRFALRFTLDLPPRTVAFLPDSIDAGAFESFGPVEWTASEASDGSVELAVTYPLIVFRSGSIAVSGIDVFTAPTGESLAAELSAPGDRVGSWAAFRETPGALASARPRTLPEQRIEVATVLALDDITTQIAPRPPADVSGGSRDWLSTTLVTVFGLLLAAVVGASVRDWAVMRREGAATAALSPREHALADLDELLSAGPHQDGRIREFYAGWSGIVRRYVEGFAEEWGPSWTSTELMDDLEAGRRRVALRPTMSADGIAREMRVAEEVKFGGVRPDAGTAEAHWRTARAWIEASGSPSPEDGAVQ